MADDIQTIGGDAEQAKSAAAETRFTQDDLNRVAAKERRVAAKLADEHEALKAKLAGFEEAQKTESQKAIEAAAKNARAAADAEWGAKLTAKEIDARLELRLLQGGYDPDLAAVVKAKAVLTSVDDIDEAISNALAGKDWAKKSESEPERKVMSQAGAPSGSLHRGNWTIDKITQWRQSNPGRTPSSEMMKEWDQSVL